jgi:hypothetical protein
MRSQTTLLGAAGEYYIMAELLRRNYIAALAPHGVPTADIIVTDVEGARQCSIQVKSRQGGIDGGWRMSAKNERIMQNISFIVLWILGKRELIVQMYLLCQVM